MVITETTMYWLTRFDYLQGFMFVFGGIGLIASFTIATILFFTAGDHYEKKRNAFYKWAKRLSLLSIIFLCSIIGGLFTPTTKEYAAIKLVPIIMNDESVQQLPEKAIELANDWLDELRPENVLEDKTD